MPRTSCARLLLVLLVLLAATSASAQGVSYLGGWSGGPPDRVEANDQKISVYNLNQSNGAPSFVAPFNSVNQSPIEVEPTTDGLRLYA